MSDKFLKEMTGITSEKSRTYSERRKRKMLEVSTSQQKRSRAQREMEAREEGLSRSLMQPNEAQVPQDGRVAEEATHTKAYRMMLKMGFQPGSALGARSSSDGAGSNEPITIVHKADRAGIGVTTRPVSAAKLPRLLRGSGTALTQDEVAQRDAFLTASRARFDGRKVDALLGRAARTGQDLDRRRGLDSNFFWSPIPPPDQLPSLSTLENLVAQEPDLHPLDLHNPLDDDEDHQNWLALDPSTRLSCILAYLREEYFYCIWCGCQYQSSEELANECPGEEEDDH